MLEIIPLNIQGLLESNDQYVIPIYQRNYAWEAKEIEQLIQDIIDYSKYHKKKNYYIGTLVVASNNLKNSDFDTIDGQQRLTTLSILSAVLKNEYPEINLKWYEKLNVRFASRKKSMNTLEAAFRGKFILEDYEVNVKAAYEIIKRELEKKTKEFGITVKDFSDYLYEFVSIIRVTLPEGIDLNHYFEIMNSRGEQLEKHEILKAKLMSCFENSEQRELYEYCFDLIWDACSNMEKYVQYGFSINQRHLLFGKEDWNDLTVYSFDDFVKRIVSSFEVGLQTPIFQKEQVADTIDDILKLPSVVLGNNRTDDQPDRYSSVINFQNFLLHVLRVQTLNDKVSLDDKRLIDIFEEILPSEHNLREDFVKMYIFNLLKCKFVYDKYIIKREYTSNIVRWSLKSLKWYSSGTTKNGVKYVNTFGEEQSEDFENENRQVLMLLSMFHVSIPSMLYKYWLNAALNYVFYQTEVDAKKYINYLEHIVKSFVFDNYLSDNSLSYFEMINKNLNPIKRDKIQIKQEKLYYGRIENLVFNFCDYLLWMKYKDSEKDSRVKSFEFTFRSSVEHFYPQNPRNTDIKKIDPNHLHSFGNLCLISHEKNSRLSDFSPIAKKDYYGKSATLDSIKQFLMMKSENWTIKEIGLHYSEMLELLENNMSSDFSWEIIEVTKARKWYKQFKSDDKVLLARVLYCFGRIDMPFGSTSGMGKYNFYQWESKEHKEIYKKYETYIIEKNPSTLQDIIDDQLQNSEELREDSYRYAFVSRPSILKYCKDGNFGWSDNGKRLVLLEYSRASSNQSCDLYCFCLNKYLKEKFEINSFCDNERLKISIIEIENRLVITSLNWNAIAFLEIWNDQKGNLCYELNTRVLHGNSKIIRNLKENGWEYNNNNRLFYSSKSYLFKLTDDIEVNITKAEKAIERLIRKL